MRKSTYIEDVFLDFAILAATGAINIQPQDFSPISSFENTLAQSKKLTQAQANYILKLLTKYKSLCARVGLDYEDNLKNPTWQNTFRVLDNSKRVSVVENDLGIEILVKFPYSLKEEFENHFPGMHSVWDSDAAVRKINLNDCNVIALAEFCQKNAIDFDQTFQDLLMQIEEIWNQENNILQICRIENGQVVLKNSDEYSQKYFDEHKSNQVNADLFLAKSMGYFLDTVSDPENIFEKIAATRSNLFRIKDQKSFYDFYKQMKDPCVVFLLDRSSDYVSETKKIVISALENNINISDIKVCYRLDAEEDKKKNFNQWVKDQGLTGSVENGKIFIFLHKPAKWLFSKKLDVNIIVTNTLWPSTTLGVVNWIESHPCSIFLSDHRPTLKTRTKKEKNIVDL